MRRTLAMLIAFGALVVAPAAQAKGPASLTICGRDECRQFMSQTHEALVFGVLETHYGSRREGAPPLAPYYTLELDGWDEWDSSIYVPSVELVGSDKGWSNPTSRTETSLERAVEWLEPFPATIASVAVDGVAADDAAAFAALFDELPRTQAVLDVPPVKIEVRGLPEAWVDRARAIEYFPKEQVMRRDHEWVKVSPAVADVIAGHPEVVVETAADGRTWPSPLWLALPALVALAGASVWLVRRALRGRERESLVRG